jgi:predicted metal-dependent phosphoesterase TrpH
VGREYLQSCEAVELIKEAGGIPVLAHPLLYHLSVSKLKELIASLIPHGLKGIEAMYSCNRGTDEAFVRKLSKEFHLLCTGGSDYHGDNKPHIQLGRGLGNLFVPEDLLDQLK